MVEKLNNLMKFAHSFLNGYDVCPEVEEYNKDLDYENEINGLFVENDAANDLKDFFDKLIITRKDLADISETRKFDREYISKIENYLEAVKNIMAFYFSYPNRKSLILGRSKTILKTIVESDMRKIDDDSIEVHLGNPMILESLLICYRQREDFYAEFKGKTDENQKNENYYRRELDRELYVNKFDRLFRDIVILYEKEFYRIVDAKFKTDDTELVDCFIAKREDSLSSIELFSATRFYEKITFGREKTDCFKVLIIGETKNDENFDSIEELEKKLRLSKFNNVKVDSLTRSDKDFPKIFTYQGLQNYIDEYDKIFILDCPELYYDIELREKIDASNIIFKSSLSVAEFPQKLGPIGFRSFYNNKGSNSFAPVYYRVQNYLIDDHKVNSSKTRNINTLFLDKIKDILSDEKKERSVYDKKEVYAYISNNRDFADELYDMFNFTRIERYNSKTCRIIKFCKKQLPDNYNSRHKMLFISLYKILKMLSSDLSFHQLFSDSKDGSFVEIYKKSSKINIIIDYSDINYDEKDGVNCNIKAYYSGEDLNNNLRTIVEMLINEMFRYGNSKDAVIKYCYKKAIADIFSGSARNFNDLLFHHLYFKTLTGFYLLQEKPYVNFDVKVYKQTAEEFEHRCDFVFGQRELPKDNYMQYSFKRLAYRIMDVLDTKYYGDGDMLKQLQSARMNEDNLNIYVNGLLKACMNLNYEDSNLYYRLRKYY